MRKTFYLFFLGLISISGMHSQSLMPFQNPKLSFEERTEDLLSRLTIKQKIELMMDRSVAIDSLGIRRFNWWNEALHGVARAGEATVFPQTIGMAASFHDDLVFQVFDAVSDEARSKHHQVKDKNGFGRYEGLTMWTPNINIFRDPRWGRGQETYGEDPYLTEKMGLAVVRGLQGPSDSRYRKLHACAKHYAVHSGPEWNRHSFDAKDISQRDLAETYMPAFESLIKQGNVREVMCAYNRYEGDPCCGSNRLLIQILRNEWDFDGLVVSDCHAIRDFYTENAHMTHASRVEASADAVLNGTDLECGSSYQGLLEAVGRGLIDESQIDVSVRRLLQARFELGEMDPDSIVSWAAIPLSVVSSEKHQQLALQMARESMTLLQNNNKALPLSAEGKIAVLGPNAHDKVMQWANYNGVPARTVTVLDGIRQIAGKENVIYDKACECAGDMLLESVWNLCSFEGKTGFKATYWNNTELEGKPATTALMMAPLQFSSAGATVFAPGVELNDFSAQYESIFTPEYDMDVLFKFLITSPTVLFVNGEEVSRLKVSSGGRRNEYMLNAKAGEKYEIKLQFAHEKGDALLNFDMVLSQPVDIDRSLKLVENVETVVFVGGISASLEGEEMKVNYPGFKGGDRTDIELPDTQRRLLQALREAGKKVVFVNCSGSAMGLEPETQSCDAILQAWYPGQEGGTAVAEVLYGLYNPAGRLPVTFYKNVSQLPDFEDYSMKERTYRYMTSQPLFPFGHGLSYAEFIYGEPVIKRSGTHLTFSLPIANRSRIDGEEVAQIYVSRKDDPHGPLKTLRAFQRVSIPAGETKIVVFELDPTTFKSFDEHTKRMGTIGGEYLLQYGGSSSVHESNTVSLIIPSDR